MDTITAQQHTSPFNTITESDMLAFAQEFNAIEPGAGEAPITTTTTFIEGYQDILTWSVSSADVSQPLMVALFAAGVVSIAAFVLWARGTKIFSR